MQKFFVPGRLPDFNSMIAAAKRRHCGWNAYHLLKQEWDAIIRYEIKQAKIRPMSRLRLCCRWQEANKRRDPDGLIVAKKFILDALVQSKIIPNDGWSEIAGFTDEFVVNPKQPGVWVTLI